MTQFDDSPNSSVDRIARSVRWVEKFRDRRDKTVLHRDSPTIFRYVLLEDVDASALFVPARISYPYHDNTDRSDLTIESELHYVGTSLHGQRAGFTGDCFWMGNVFWSISQIERTERFRMESDWFLGYFAIASFRLIEETVYDQVGILEDPEQIFQDQIGYLNTGISTRSRSGRHFILQAKCDQDVNAPEEPPGVCSFTLPDGESGVIGSTLDQCNAIGGEWVPV